MPYDAPHAFLALRDGQIVSLPNFPRWPDIEIVEAFAEHGIGIASERNPDLGGPFTRICTGRPHHEGGAWVGNVDGHLPDGAIHISKSHGKAYRLTLVKAPAWREA